ncbi:putative bifunctional diguanylate cyclase/phosphodiesterase [Arcobacter sp. s6]|uniref:putative bifunctional diguanylate cyclase/phosphodiesterase n=1 Tax=Arcobacter sp. s6 TaxID=3230363 RepID=UPI0034A0666F
MIMNIKRLVLLFFTFVIVSLYTIFTHYFNEQENKLANVILKILNNNIIETSYTISKTLKTQDDIFLFKAQLDRNSANDDFIAAIAIFDNHNNLLLTTDPDYIKAETQLNKKYDNAYYKLLNKKYLEDEIKFYEGINIKKLRLIYFLEQDELNAHFTKNRINYLTYFGIPPIIIFIIIFILLRKYVTKPLEELRQYAYYNNIVPKAFKVRELESIRYSMVDTFSRLETEKKELYLMARTDSLSGLSNRNSLNEYLERLILNFQRSKKEFAFLYLDIDHFKTVNDSLGHNIGDELLQSISTLFKNILRPNDFIARIGGDEFVIIIQDYKSYFDLSMIIDRIQKELSKNWTIKTNPITISCSIGISFFPKDGKTQIELMKNADIAMYEAKKLGRNQYHFYTEKLNETVQESIRLDKNMRLALKNNNYQLFYQAKVDIKSSNIIGVEALIRWISPKNGLINPSSFIPLAEENNFIQELGEWIINDVVRQYVQWREIGIDIVISINISAKQLLIPDFAHKLISKLKKNKINASKIDLEITEYIFMQDSNTTKNNLKKLYDYGISISMDDFGTGYSSLSYLKKFPITYLKIDKSFLDDFDTEEGSVFIETIVKLGQTLNIKIIAEGIEKVEQLEYLKKIKCDEYQGFYCSKPLNAKDFEKFYLDMKN